MDAFVQWVSSFIENFALLVVYLLEFMGIIVIVSGAFKAIIDYVSKAIKKEKYNFKINLGNALAVGLEFKMGAEIIKTVVVRTIDELLILGAIILLRAILAVLIHWEIKTEKTDILEDEKILEENSKEK